MKFNFQIRLFINLALLIASLFIILGVWLYIGLTHQLYNRISYRAEHEAEQIASIPDLQQAIESHNIKKIASIMDTIVKFSDASFIVVGDTREIHLYHSVTPAIVGKQMIGGDNASVLAGKSTITKRKGTLGLSLRSKVPVFNAKGKVIGIISVGYLQSYLDEITLGHIVHITFAVLFIIAILFIFSWLFTRSIKRQMFSLEPCEIGMLVRQQKAILESIYEGVIVIDTHKRVKILNQAAKKLLNIQQAKANIQKNLMTDIIQDSAFLDPQIMESDDAFDEIVIFNRVTIVASRVRVYVEGKLQGWVITFRDQNTIDRLSEQLSQVKHYVNDLRVMRHEQLNRISTISGLLTMGHYDEALHYIQTQSSHIQLVLDFLTQRFQSPLLCGLLLGKYSRAQEKGITLNFDPGCFMPQQSTVFSESELISIVGNLLDNAIEATQKVPLPHRPIDVLVQQNERELLIEVADYGIGISSELKSRMFQPGVTTKQDDDHGLGLHLISSYVLRANGLIEVSDNAPHGTIFSLFIPSPLPYPTDKEEPDYATRDY
ncbi:MULTISPECIES: sensor histidine kinase [Enterobacteriaceae]|uniref:ATP-binding protein n=1 Tax=Klebsiella sp. 141161 TaxID=3020037 RepID=UPI000DE19863